MTDEGVVDVRPHFCGHYNAKLTKSARLQDRYYDKWKHSDFDGLIHRMMKGALASIEVI